MPHTDDMRVLLKMVLDCPPDAAWLAIRSPDVLRDVSGPFMTLRSLDPGGFPAVWEEGDHHAAVSGLGVVPLGEQLIRISFADLPGGVRMMRDSGGGLSGALSIVTRWQHSLTVSAAPGGRTLYRDQLIIETGPFTLLLWPTYWAFWQWRALKMKRAAPTWAVPRTPGTDPQLPAG